MLTFDQLRALPDNVKMHYLKALVEKHIQDAPETMQLRLRHTQSKMNGIRRQFKDPMTATWLMYDAMLESLNELRQALDGELH